MKDAILNWYGNGETGISSKAMAQAVIGNTPFDNFHTFGNHPSDTADLNRCLKFLHAVPEAKNHLDKVAKLSPQWNRLIARWDELEKCFIDEVGFDWCKAKSAPKTYNLMKNIMNP